MTNEFKFNASEYAKMLGITTSAVRKRRLQGKLEGEYVKKDSEYFYKSPRGDRPNKDKVTPYHNPKFHGSVFRPKKYPCYYHRKRTRNVPYDMTQYANASNGHQLQLTNDLRQKMRIDSKLKASDLEYLTDELVHEVYKKKAKEKADRAKQVLESRRSRRISVRNNFPPSYEPKMTGRWFNHATGQMEDYDKPKIDYSKRYYG